MRQKLESVLASMDKVAIAISGGVDSMTLAIIAHRLLGKSRVAMMHAVSPAVVPEATGRVHQYGDLEGWDLHVIDAREFADRNYIANPVNRCFFCKGNLYGEIARVSGRQILSGTNVDDLGEYRPGLDAARNHAVRHPYLEAGIEKKTVRSLARSLGLPNLAELPSSPCLSSRVETDIAIQPEMLEAVHAVERLMVAALAPQTVRCRVRKSAIVIELDAASLTALKPESRPDLIAKVISVLPASLGDRPVGFAAYRNGSAFVGASL